MGKMHRAQILIDPKQHETLAEIAQREGASISELVRQAVQNWLNEHHGEELRRRQLQALTKINQHRQTILDRRGGQPLEVDLEDIIEQIREERDDELLSGMFDHHC
ncbi:MAG: plasmid partition protein ParG [Anaerolineales bacterium]